MTQLTPLDWSEEILKEIFRNTSVGFVLIDLHGTIIETNDAFERMLDRKGGHIIGSRMEEYVHHLDHDMTNSLLSRLCSGEIGNYDVVRRFILPGGRELTTKVTASVIRSETDELICGIELVEDIGARLEAEKALRSSELRYRRVVEDQSDFIVRWLPNGSRLFVNDAYCRYFETSRERLLGTSLFPLIAKEDRTAFRQRISRLSPENPSSTDQHRVLRPDGRVAWHEWTDRAIFGDSGQIVELQSVGRDVTDQRSAEEALIGSESRYRRIFHDLPIAAWEVDWSEVIDYLHSGGFELVTGPEMISEFRRRVRSVRVLAANPLAFRLAGVDTLEELADWNLQAYPDESIPPVIKAVLPLLEGKVTSAQVEIPMIRADGTRMEVLIRWAHTASPDAPWHSIVTMQDLTEKKETERAVETSEAKFRRFFHELPIPAWISDWSAVVAELNRLGIGTAEEMRELIRERPGAFATVGRRTRLLDVNPLAIDLVQAGSLQEFEEWFPAGYGPVAAERIVEASLPLLFEGAGMSSVELPITTYAGEHRDLLLQWARSGSDDEPWVFAVTALDLTARKGAEEALRESEEKYRGLFNDLPIAVWMADWTELRKSVHDRNLRSVQDLLSLLEANPEKVREMAAGSRVLEANPVALEIVGVDDRKDLLPRLLGGLTPGILRRLLKAVGPLLFEDRHVTSVELTCVFEDGRRVDLLTRWARTEPRASSWRFIVSAVDVTERNRIERDLESQRRLLEQAEAMAKLGSWEWEARQGRISGSDEYNHILGNPAAEGWTMEQFIERVHPDDRQLVRDSLASEPGGAIGEPVEFRMVTSEGEEKQVKAQGYFTRSDDGALTGGFGTLQDITEMKRAERDASRHRDELVRADKMISLGILVSGVAHEINNPNHFIMLNTPLLRDAWNDALPALEHWDKNNSSFRLAGLEWKEMRQEVPQVIDEILQGAERIKTIVADLKNFARDPEHGMKSEVSLNEVVRSALRLIANRLKNSTRHLTVVYGDDLPPARGNRQKLEQVIINLVLNACDALEDPDRAIRITTGNADDSQQTVFVRVQDEGRGISPADLDRITDPFFTTRRTSGGTGLGLAVSSRIVEEHHGELRFESEQGKGTTATMVLPVEPSGEESE